MLVVVLKMVPSRGINSHCSLCEPLLLELYDTFAYLLSWLSFKTTLTKFLSFHFLQKKTVQGFSARGQS